MKDMLNNPARWERIIDVLRCLYPDAECSLEYNGDPWRLLVASRLSAQCTDARVNTVTPVLFERFPDAAAMSRGELPEIEEIIRPCGLHRTKAASIQGMSRMIAEEYGGHVPDSMDGLLKLPGVGRKIANLILGDVYGRGGIVADTHCIRICGRLGCYPTSKKDPLLTERVMERIIPVSEQSSFCHRIVRFGREYCTARNPRCQDCPLAGLCPARQERDEKTDVR